MANKRILVATDGSDNAMRALEYAIERVTEAGSSEIHLLTVHPALRVYGEVQVYVSRERMRDLAEAHDRAVLLPAVERLRRSGVRFTSESLEGDPAMLIAQRADELGCSEIVLGSHGWSVVASLVMGSVATKVVHLTRLPVTLVK